MTQHHCKAWLCSTNRVGRKSLKFSISELAAGEQRFVSSIAKRFQNVDALIHGDRRADEQRDLGQFNGETEYDQAAVKAIMEAVMGRNITPIVSPPADYTGNFLRDAKVGLKNVGITDSNDINVTVFLNRLLGMPVDLQKILFQYFTETLASIENRAKENGNFDLGILDLEFSPKKVQRKKTLKFTIRHSTGTADTFLQTFLIDKGISWMFLLTQKTLADVGKLFRMISIEEAKPLWKAEFKTSKTMCYHERWGGKCDQTTGECDTGLRYDKCNILSGPVLSVWAKVEAVIIACGKMDIVRLRTVREILEFMFQAKGKTIKYLHLLNLFQHDQGRGSTGLSVVPKLKSVHLNPNSFQRMSVKLAV
ncbi:hypothetical protein DAPPUDRAFT_322034 [Daphnia pulex]|uniref:Uncharacterized protein n=1 Tax=Daphnia pulex TaxID=6669 RepID=E9GUE3_DAPPU|nr:hypothetical protein DAPPUDRAFT_322034 [Daphnia pulex]|eukprot:EFX76862.1 hypothetical protein DAPPUDRAFT_322034 [Daphnia pulex]